jgi:hypothetical protein
MIRKLLYESTRSSWNARHFTQEDKAGRTARRLHRSASREGRQQQNYHRLSLGGQAAVEKPVMKSQVVSRFSLIIACCPRRSPPPAIIGVAEFRFAETHLRDRCWDRVHSTRSES